MSQSDGSFFDLKMVMLALRYLWNLSQAAFPVGLYPPVATFLMPHLLHNSCIPLLINSLPWSLTIFSGDPCTLIKLSKSACAIVALSLSGIAIAIGHLEKWSTILRIHLFPAAVVGKVPTISIPTICQGLVDCVISVNPACVGLGVLRTEHPEHAWIHLRISLLMPFQ